MGQVTPSDRGRMIWKLADLLEQNADEFAELESLNNGKSLAVAPCRDVPLSCRHVPLHGGLGHQDHRRDLSISRPGNFHAYTVREPVGVVGQIMPWNARC